MSGYCKLAIFVVMLYVLQTSFFPLIAYHGISPDFMLLLTVSYAFLKGTEKGTLMGFITGLMMDLATGTFFGIHAFTHLIIGNICGRFANRVYKEQFFLPVFASLGVTTFNYFILALLMVLLGYRFNPISNVQVTLLPMLIYQLAFAYPVHYLTYQLDKKLSLKDTN
ncbi:putative rod shape-determining protein MreD [Selenomonas ruminantium subsp. lactilytica TAM6421]|uniref:Putative rod shape-determining protein MreD n=1 Tax=Selenomonas ruminantium subsp. lactilytica (strain NBRC 103574 / TAM6421) TaxID=927704 RepID=I0GTM3_SELRL|nr:rod shape-determining protein MreD [Selenomonas ruminantium]BAL84110.1 putative rod shape-determining protein MreD [Selenomonas ruminantium subsp. lactilytica TAM6421]